jgi:transcriptional regulator
MDLEVLMFVRACWRPNALSDLRDLIDANPWALLVSQSEDGPLATNLPLLVEKSDSSDEQEFMLVSHLARANEHLESLRKTTTPVLAIFEGPWSYVTASWYPQRQMPSTYYYTAVHCYGRIEFQNEAELDRSLEVLVNRMESQYPDGWKTSEIPRSEVTRRLPAIIGFRMHVSRVEAKFKLGQDEPLHDALAVADALDSRDTPQDRMLAAMIREQNADRS